MTASIVTSSVIDIKVLEDQGWELLEQRRYDEAIKVFSEVFRRDEWNIAAFQGTIASLRKKRDFKEAHALLDKALNIYPEHPGILSERAWIYVERKEKDKAIEAFNAVLRANEKAGKRSADPFIWKIHLLRDQRRFEEAEKLTQEACNLFPGNFDCINEIGWLLFHQNHYGSAISEFEKTLRVDQQNESALQGLIASLRMSRRFTEAERLLDKALKCPNTSAGIHSERGWLNLEQGRYEEAEHEFERALSLKPDDPYAHVNLAWSLLRQDNPAAFERAVMYCQKALALDPSLAQAFGCLGVVAFKQGHIHEAEDYLLHSIKADSREGQYADLGALYIQMGRYDEAEKRLKQAVRNNPDDVYAHIQIGNLYLQTEKTKEAIREFHWAMAVDPDKIDSSRALAIAFMENNKIDEAEKVLRNAIRASHKFNKLRQWELRLTLCQLLTRLGDETEDPSFYEEALKEVNIIATIKPDHPTVYFYRGIVRFKIGDYRGSIKNFQRCLEKYNYYTEAELNDSYYIEAELNIKRVQSLIDGEKNQYRANQFASIFLVSIFVIQLIALWTLRFFWTDRVTDTMLTVLVPILLGLMVIATLLPWLNRLKMTGLEAELSEPKPKEAIASGRKGEIGFGSTLSKPGSHAT